MNAIETRGLVKSFKGFRAVDGLDLNVPEGSIYGFLGPNGAGKTTTIKMLTGLSQPTGGSIRICGREAVFGSLKNRSDIGYLPDVPNFYDWMDAREFLTFAGELFAIDKRTLDKRIESLLKLVGLSGVKKKTGGFSRGMKQRLGIAQALINQPKVVLMDEPVSALDPIGRKEIMDILAGLSGKVTVFLSSHILGDIERICDRVAILDKGRMVMEDTMDSLKRRYSRRVIMIETDAGEKKRSLIGELDRREWVEKVTDMDNGELRLEAAEMLIAQREIPGIMAEAGAALKRFAVLEPTLEDIFIKVVDNK